MNISKIKQEALKYLGYYGQNLESSFLSLFDSCLEEIISLQNFKVTYATYKLEDCPISLQYPGLETFFAGCSNVVFIGCTLGIELERKLKYYQAIDLTRMCVMDSIASAYVEVACDAFEEEHFPKERTYRFCPGYGKVPIELNKEIAKHIDLYKKTGITITDTNLLIPQKSMIGFIGIGKNQPKKSCIGCMHSEGCSFRKRGQTCY
ncbi:MAG: vitamin B12 dependent methionine synthase [Bacillota bacterium]|nr:vitamin B12 dependent methionine synthase [Bacillota bacterium]